MSVSKHTTGPWRHEPTNSAKLTYVAVSTIAGANGSTVVIGQCPGPDREANARLIAAAPDLLSALQVLRTQALQSPDLLSTDYGQEALTAASAAIARAAGET